MPLLFALLAALFIWAGPARAAGPELLNVSYDPTRELYQDINDSFGRSWKDKTGQTIRIYQSHGGSGKQARSVMDGLEADVVTLALADDIDTIAAKSGLIDKNWQSRLPFNSTPYTSTIVLVVRKGNPKGIKDWGDLARPGILVIAPNPKTGGGARWNYLAAWGWAEDHFHGDKTQIESYMGAWLRNVPVWDTGARGSTTTFAQRNMGDVLLAWENEAYLIGQEFGDNFEIVTPSASIMTEPSVALVDKVVDKHGTRAAAQAYLEYLYSPTGQDIIAAHHFRPRDAKALSHHPGGFAAIPMFTIDRFGGWATAQAVHFADGGTYDQLLNGK